MSFIPQTAAALVMTGAACTAALMPQSNSTPAADITPPAITCDLQVTQQGREIRIIASAQSDKPVSGQYKLEITQDSSGGKAQIRQTGDFDLTAGVSASLAEARLSGSEKQFHAELHIQDQKQHPLCSATTPAKRI